MAKETTRAGSDDGAAPDVVVLAEPSLAAAMRQAGRLFRKRSGAPVIVFAAPGFALAAEAARGARCDLLVLARTTMEKAEQSRLVLRGAQHARFTTPLVIAAAAGEGPLPSLSAAALRHRLGARRFACPDQTIASPIASQAVLQRLGLAALLAGRTIGGALTSDVAFYLRRGVAAFGLLYLADARAAKLAVAATLPPAEDNPASFEAALSSIRRSRFAEPFVAFLRSPGASEALAAAGVRQA